VKVQEHRGVTQPSGGELRVEPGVGIWSVRCWSDLSERHPILKAK
jgi:hypothetical protein